MRPSHLGRILALLFALFVLSSCSDVRPIGDDNRVFFVEQFVTEEGATLRVAGASLWIPPNATRSRAFVSLRRLSPYDATPEGLEVNSRPAFEVQGTNELVEPPILRIDYESEWPVALASGPCGLHDSRIDREHKQVVITLSSPGFFIVDSEEVDWCPPNYGLLCGECQTLEPDPAEVEACVESCQDHCDGDTEACCSHCYVLDEFCNEDCSSGERCDFDPENPCCECYSEGGDIDCFDTCAEPSDVPYCNGWCSIDGGSCVDDCRGEETNNPGF